MEHMANTFLTKKVGSPCESFSVVPGSARQIRRTRSTCFSPLSGLGCFVVCFTCKLHPRSIRNYSSFTSRLSLFFASLRGTHGNSTFVHAKAQRLQPKAPRKTILNPDHSTRRPTCDCPARQKATGRHRR